MLSYHSGLRKTLRWYKKVDIDFFEIFLVNVLYLYNRSKVPASEKIEIKTSIAKWHQHLLNHNSPIRKFSLIFITLPKTNPTKPCRICSKNKVRKESRYFYEKSKDILALSVDPCFWVYHHQRLGNDTTSSEDDN